MKAAVYSAVIQS